MVRTAIFGTVVSITLTAATLAAQAAANNPLIVWQGAATLTAVPAACAASKYKAGDSAFAVFRPRLDPAEPNSGLTLSFGRSGHAYFRTGGASSDQMNGNSTYSSPWFSGRATSTAGGNTGNIILALSPATVLDTTPVVTISGTIQKFHGIAGCNVNFNGAFQRRLN